MDHARHLAPPSPNSSFLFHHSERPFKSSLLTPPLLTSTSDVGHHQSVVTDCFSLTTNTTNSNNQTNLTTRLQESFGDNHDDRSSILVNHDDSNHNVTNITQTDHLDHGHQNHCVISGLNGHGHNGDNEDDNGGGGGGNHNHNNNNNNDDDDDDDDVVDGMHNMLSGSSTSSTTTIPLLGDNHSHNPFSRISLSEYSPLSLVDDCDNALTISPTSLVCGSHHSFKSSLNNLKLENLDGVDVNVDDVVGDARSMSPSLLSTNTSSNHQNQSWSISSTAITQNPALLNNSSASFLLSHHHHHQLNSLMQQLEPQSLDESPPLIGHSLMLDTDLLSHNHHHHHHHRPSSEPPPASDLLLDISGHVETKSNSTKQQTSSQANSTKSKQQSSKCKSTVTTSTNSAPTTSSNKSSRKNRNKTPKSKQDEKVDFQEQEKKRKATAQTSAPATDSSYSSKAHLQLNHHQKLKELQQRLFGTPTTTTTTTTTTSSSSSANSSASTSQSSLLIGETTFTTSDVNTSESVVPLEEVQLEAPVTTSKPISAQDATKPIEFEPVDLPTNNTSRTTDSEGPEKTATSAKVGGKARFRRTPKRKTKQTQNELGNSSSPPSSVTGSNAAQKSVKTESVEPDTTTKSSDCIKLADLLSTTNSIDSNSTNPTIILSNNSTNGPDFNNLCEQTGQNDTKRIQHIQLQVSPPLKFMANGSLVQSMSLQQQLTNNVAIVSSGCGSFSNNQVICRPVNVMTTVSGGGGNINNNGASSDEQTKCNTISTNDWLKTGDTATLSTCVNSNQSNHQPMNGAMVSALNNAIGAHQIAIQVICQDGTSLVLPVSAASGLSAGITQSGPNQQLQAVLTNGIKNGVSLQQRSGGAQMMPLISVSNILAQQQQQQQANNQIHNIDNGVNISDGQSSRQTNGNSTQSTGLAASSPTLAALLDAGSNRINISNNNNNNNNNDPNNLLRKCVGGNVELRRGEFNLQPGTQIGLTNNGSLVTICATNNYSNATNHAPANSSVKLNHGAQCLGDKRIKLENVQEVRGNIQTTFTLIEPQNVLVANGNDDDKLLQADQGAKPNETHQQVKLALGLQTLTSETSNPMKTTTLQQQLNSTTSMKPNSDNAASISGKQNKMTSSTGNRPVDPTQPFRCEHCNSTFTRLGNFTRHKKIHSAPTKDGQRFKCDVCSKSFLQRCDLARHLHIHRGTEPHRCNICGKGYIRHSDLVTHQRFHNKEKPFGCPNCHKGFCQRGDLNRHLRSIHLQLKPLLCPCCNRKFAKRDTLLKHLSTHHRQYPIEMLPP